MPKCIVDYCHNYAGMRKNYANVILHGFPTTLDRIRSWLRSLERGGQVFENLEEMAMKIHEGKKHDSYRVCSEHFSKHCYSVSGDKKVLNKEAVPTIFTPCVMDPRCHHKQEPLSRQAKEFLKRRTTEEPEQNSRQAKQFCKDIAKSAKHGEELTEIVLNLTLEIIYLLTGEAYALVRRTQSPMADTHTHSLIHERHNEEKILRLTNKIIELLTGEVPIRCQDVTVYFSMEEWEYLEGHKDLYKEVMMDDHQTRTSPGLPHDQMKSLPRISCSNPQYTMSRSVRQKPTCLKMAKKVKELRKNLSKTPNSCDMKDLSEADVLYSHLSPFIKEELDLSDGGSLTPYTHTNPTEVYLSPQDMAVLVPSVLPNGSMCTPSDTPQNCPSTQITEFLPQHRENFTYSGTYIPTDHTLYNPPHHIKVEAESTTTYTPHNPPAQIRVEYTPCEAESTRTFTFYTQHPSTRVKEEPVMYEVGDLIDPNIYTPTNHLLQHPYPHIKETLDMYDGGNSITTNMSMPTGHTQRYQSSDIKEEPVSLEECNVNDNTLSFRCMECSEAFISKSDLAYHQTIHRIEKLKCPECGKYFSNKSNLSNHIRSHTGEKPYSCPACGKRFTRKSTLIIHQRIHTGEKPFVCLECGRCFPGKGNLMKHQKVHKAKKLMTVKTFIPMPMTLIVDSNLAPLQMLQ